jgi:hypothetical protein
MDNVQNCDSYINIQSSQAHIQYFIHIYLNRQQAFQAVTYQ